MSARDDLLPIIEEVDVLLAELRELNTTGPHFRIVHRFHRHGTVCAPGEEIAAVYLVYRGREYWLRLPVALRILFDYLARHSGMPQNATQIEAGIRCDPFYRRHAANASNSFKLNRAISRSFVRVYIARLRSAMTTAFRDANLSVNPAAVIASRTTVMNEVGYQLRGSAEWLHDHRGFAE